MPLKLFWNPAGPSESTNTAILENSNIKEWALSNFAFQSSLVNFFLNYMHGLKSAILVIFQKGLGWPCPVSAALRNAS